MLIISGIHRQKMIKLIDWLKCVDGMKCWYHYLIVNGGEACQDIFSDFISTHVHSLIRSFNHPRGCSGSILNMVLSQFLDLFMGISNLNKLWSDLYLILYHYCFKDRFKNPISLQYLGHEKLAVDSMAITAILPHYLH